MADEQKEYWHLSVLCAIEPRNSAHCVQDVQLHALFIQKTIHTRDIFSDISYPNPKTRKWTNLRIKSHPVSRYAWVLSKNNHLTWPDRNTLLFNKCEKDNSRRCAIRNSTLVKYTLSIHEHWQIKNTLNASFLLSFLSIRIDVSSVPKKYQRQYAQLYFIQTFCYAPDWHLR